MKGQSTDGGKMVMLGEVLSLATSPGAIMGKFWQLWVYRLLKNPFVTIVYWVKLMHIPSPNPKVHVLLCKYCYILRTRNSILSRHLHLELSQHFLL